VLSSDDTSLAVHLENRKWLSANERTPNVQQKLEEESQLSASPHMYYLGSRLPTTTTTTNTTTTTTAAAAAAAAAAARRNGYAADAAAAAAPAVVKRR
jgi:hypothetical protein